VALAFHARLTPNAVTGISAACTYSGIGLLALLRPTWTAGLVVAGLLVVGYAFDSADGQLARLRGGGSAAGEWLDHMVDAGKIASLHLGLLVGLDRSGTRGAWLLLPLAFSVVSVVLFFAMLLNDALRVQHGAAPRSRPAATRPGTVRSLLAAPTDYGVLCLVFLLLGDRQVFLAVYGVLLLATGGYLALASVRWFREMNGLGR
jgi:phosphatidylglycerophosphate synthase